MKSIKIKRLPTKVNIKPFRREAPWGGKSLKQLGAELREKEEQDYIRALQEYEIERRIRMEELLWREPSGFIGISVPLPF